MSVIATRLRSLYKTIATNCGQIEVKCWRDGIDSKRVFDECLTTMLRSTWRSLGQDLGLGMTNLKSGDYNLFSLVQVLEFFRWHQCWFHEIEISAIYSDTQLGLNQLFNVVDQWLRLCVSGHSPVGLCLGQGSLILLVGQHFHFPQWFGIQQKRNVCPSHSITRAGSWFGK